MKITIRYPQISDKVAFIDAMKHSEKLHDPWVNPPKSEDAFKAFIEKYAMDNNISYLVLVDEKIAGVININEIIRGAFQNAFLSYYVVYGFAGQRVMSRGLKLVLTKVFGEHGLHRVEANIQPENTSSIHLVKQNGFKKEGFSSNYLRIKDKWCDHERWALIKEDFVLKKV